MLYEKVAEFYGLEVNDNLIAVVKKSRVTLSDWTLRNRQARKRMERAMNKVTDQLIEDQMAKTGVLIHPNMDRQVLAEYIFSQMKAARKTTKGMLNAGV